MNALAMTTLEFVSVLFWVSLAGALCFILGAHMSYMRGYGDGLADAAAEMDDLEDDDDADDIAEIRWELTASGREALQAELMAAALPRASRQPEPLPTP